MQWRARDKDTLIKRIPKSVKFSGMPQSGPATLFIQVQTDSGLYFFFMAL